jgi:glycine/D-amino acid oxidase-like deaminating enzyme
LWWSQIDATSPRHSLRGAADVDVAIVGGGYTGLWTARELLRRDPQLRVCVLEARVCGFGASGRNGG